MKIKSMFTAFKLKALLVIICITIGCASFTKCDAQSIVGKWNELTTKVYFTAEGIKEVGKPFISTQISSIGTVVVEFKDDHTMITTVKLTNNPKASIVTGTWSVSGNNLETKSDANQADPKDNPKKDEAFGNATILLSSNTLLLTQSMINPRTPTLDKMERYFTKM